MVVGVYVPQLHMVPGFHAAVNDAGGKSIVVEFINGETKVYDNPISRFKHWPL
jgi:penicillin V acylase-like amidase (Ntn superfamily)